MGWITVGIDSSTAPGTFNAEGAEANAEPAEVFPAGDAKALFSTRTRDVDLPRPAPAFPEFLFTSASSAFFFFLLFLSPSSAFFFFRTFASVSASQAFFAVGADGRLLSH